MPEGVSENEIRLCENKNSPVSKNIHTPEGFSQASVTYTYFLPNFDQSS